MPETLDTSGFGGGIDTHVPSIDGPLPGTETADQSVTDTTTETTGDQPTEQPSGTESTDTDQTSIEAQPVYSKNPVLNGLINKFAKDHPELDPTDAAHLKILNRMANQEKYIRDLKAKSAAPADGLTDFERSLLPQAQQQQPPAQQQQPPPQQQGPAPVGAPLSYFDGDPGVAWKSPKDAYDSLNKAWQAGDLDAVNNTELGIFMRRASNIGLVTMEAAQQMVERAIQTQLGDVLPAVRETAATARSQANKEFAITELEKSPDWGTVRELEQELEGEPISYNGQHFPNTKLNQILITNPEILDINVRHRDPDTADRLTYLARYRAAMRVAKSGQIDGKRADQLLQAGSKMEQRRQGDRVRQGMNSGTGATGLPNGKKTGSFVEGLLNVDGGPRSFSNI